MRNRVIFQGVSGLVLGMMVMQVVLNIQRDIRPLLMVGLSCALILYLSQRLKPFLIGAIIGLVLVPIHLQINQSVPTDVWQSNEVLGVVESTSRIQESAVVTVKAYLKDQKWESVDLRVKVYGIRGIAAGEGIQIKGVFQDLKSAENPYGYDQRQSYYARGLKGIFYAENNGLVMQKNATGLIPVFLHLREQWLRRIEDASDYGGYWMGFVLGEDETIPEEALTLIRRTGLAHVLAVSGMHVVLVYGFVTFVVGKAIRRKQTQDILILLVLIFYLILNVMSFTVLRAVAFLIYHRLAFYHARRPDAVTIISLIAGVDLLLNAYDLFDLSFLLCIGSTLSIAFLYRSIHKGLAFLGETLASSIGIIVSAQIGVLPIQLYVFNVFYPESFIFNLLFVPLFSVGICLSFVLSCLSFVPYALPALATVFDVFMGLLENTLWRMGNLLSFPLALTGLQVMVATTMGLCIVGCFKMKGLKNRATLSSICVLFMILLMGMSYQPFRILIFSTGKSDAMVIQHRGQTYMIDTGTGKIDLSLLLLKNDIRQLEGVIISHDDMDHIGGLPAIQQKIPIKKLVQGHSGPESFVDKDLSLQLLYGDENMTDNDGSIITLLTYKAFTMLFMGDAELKREQALIDSGRIGDVDAIKIGHHGSNTSTGTALLETTKPKLALICSDGSRYFPRQDVVDRLQEYGILVYRTDVSGCIELRLTPDGIRIHDYLRDQNEL